MISKEYISKFKRRWFSISTCWYFSNSTCLEWNTVFDKGVNDIEKKRQNSFYLNLLLVYKLGQISPKMCWKRYRPSKNFLKEILNLSVIICFSLVQFFATLWTVARQAPLSMGFSRQEYWSGLPCPPPGDLPYTGIKPKSPVFPAFQVDSLPPVPPGKPIIFLRMIFSILVTELQNWCFNFVAFYSFKCHMLVWTILSIYLNFYFKIIHLPELDLLLENSSLCTLVSSAIKKVYYLVLLGMFHNKQFSVLFYYESLNIFRHCLENAFGLSINKYWSITYFSQVLCKYNKEYKQSINYVSCTTVTYNLKWPHMNSTNYNRRQNVCC